jgi:hypothetical protein
MTRIFSKLTRQLLGAEGIDRRLRSMRSKIKDDLEKQVKQQASLKLHIEEVLRSIDDFKFGRIALVTSMPPSDTGIAFFSARMAVENDGIIDVFTSYDSVEDYFDQKSLFSNVRIFPVELLGFLCRQANYKAVIFSFGNSHHNLFVIEKLHKFSKLGLAAKIIAEVHDPCLLNIVNRFWSGRGKSDIGDFYGDRLKEKSGRTKLELIKQNVFGVKAALYGTNVNEILVHSSRAREMILQDYGVDASPKIKLGFHPVFLPENFHDLDPDSRTVSVASFGIPGDGKFLREKMNAFVRLKREGHIDTATFAGYHASKIIKETFGRIPREVNVIEDPSDKELSYLMASTTIAVQLRRMNLGESSGVVPQLLAYKKNVICNRVGAFAEYGSVVKYIEKEVSADAIYDAILNVVKSGERSPENIADFLESHQSQKLIDLIED